MSDQDAVLFANEAFYAAFAGRDVAAMERVWAKDKTISCTHPGWQPLVGRAEVLASWRAILGNSAAPRITCRAERAAIYGDCAIVTCIEQITNSKGNAEFITATNVFVRAGHIWVMVHHQAGPVNLDPQSLEEEETPALN